MGLFDQVAKSTEVPTGTPDFGGILATVQNAVTAANNLAVAVGDLDPSVLVPDLSNITVSLSSMSGTMTTMSVTLSSMDATLATMATTLSSMDTSIATILSKLSTG